MNWPFLNGGQSNTYQKLKIHQNSMFYTWLDADWLVTSEKNYFKTCAEGYLVTFQLLEKEVVALLPIKVAKTTGDPYAIE